MVRSFMILVGGISLLVPRVALAVGGSISDGDAIFTYSNSAAVVGAVDYMPDGGGAADDQLTQNWWWYRITSGQGPIHEAPLSWPPATESYMGNTAILGGSELGLFSWTLTAVLDDMAAPGTAEVSQTLEITNITNDETLDIVIFNYADYQVGADANFDFVVSVGPSEVEFGDTLQPLRRATLAGVPPFAGNFEVADAATLLASLNDLTITQPMNNFPGSPGDLAVVVEYPTLPSLSPGGMVSVAELLPVAFLPEPATGALLMVGAAALLRRRRAG